MKKLTTLVLAAGLVVSSFAGSASAAEFKPFAQFAEEFTYSDGGEDYKSYQKGENFNAATRVRFGFDYVASEDLSATVLFQYLHSNWGNNPWGKDRMMKDPNVDENFKVRLAYIDWTIPATDVKVRMGRQAVVAPSYAFGSAVLDGRADAVSFNAPVTENINLGFAWMRLNSSDYPKTPVLEANKSILLNREEETDALMLNAEFAYDGFKVAPWFMYINEQPGYAHAYTKGVQADPVVAHGPVAKIEGSHSYVLGASAELTMFDPFVFAVDAVYNKINVEKDWNSTPAKEDSFDAFYVGAKGSYKLSNGTVALGGWYASGEEHNLNGKPNGNKAVVLDSGFGASTILFGDNIIGQDAHNTLTNDNPFGTWGLLAEYAGFSFLENLSHTARVVYVEGTNEYDDRLPRNTGIDFASLTEDDSLVEFDFNSTYQIYKNFAATLELGYVLVDQANLAAGQEEADDIFRSALTFVYKF